MDIQEYKKLAKLVRDNELYKVYDLSSLKNLTVSLTELNPQKATTGHSHEGADEVYIFIEGEGEIEIGGKISAAKSGDIFLIPAGDFHKVYNKSEKNLVFWTVFEKYEGRGK
ncbi:MAG: cupin domain-containing protein [Patescibacteria group bacterium]|nr:cupin domain-containing protein [Patescibacteria group bacterium]